MNDRKRELAVVLSEGISFLDKQLLKLGQTNAKETDFKTYVKKNLENPIFEVLLDNLEENPYISGKVRGLINVIDIINLYFKDDFDFLSKKYSEESIYNVFSDYLTMLDKINSNYDYNKLSKSFLENREDRLQQSFTLNSLFSKEELEEQLKVTKEVTNILDNFSKEIQKIFGDRVIKMAVAIDQDGEVENFPEEDEYDEEEM